MKEKDIREMVLDIVAEVDYDIWKEVYNFDTAEDPDEVQTAIETLITTAEKWINK